MQKVRTTIVIFDHCDFSFLSISAVFKILGLSVEWHHQVRIPFSRVFISFRRAMRSIVVALRSYWVLFEENAAIF
jgi:hypothetical protein